MAWLSLGQEDGGFGLNLKNRYRTFVVSGKAGPADSYTEACSEAQREFDREYARLERRVEREDGEIRTSYNTGDRHWTRGDPDYPQHFCEVRSQVLVRYNSAGLGHAKNSEFLQVSGMPEDEYISQNRLLTPLESSLLGLPTGFNEFSAFKVNQVDALADLLNRIRGRVQQRYGQGHWAGWKVDGGALTVDFENSDRLPDNVREYTRTHNNASGTTAFEWTISFEETFTSRQSIELTTTVRDTAGATIGISYSGLDIGGELQVAMDVSRVVSNSITSSRTVREEYSSTIPAGKNRSATMRIVSGELMAKITGNIVYDIAVAIPTGCRNNTCYYDTRLVSEFIPESERSYPIEGLSKFSTFEDVQLVVEDS